MSILLRFEIKKILKKKSTWVTFITLLLIQTFLAASGSLGSTYVDGKFLEPHIERNRIDRRNGLALSQRAIDDTLIAELQAAYDKLGDADYTEYVFSDIYQSEVRPYSPVYDLITYWTRGTGGNNALNITAEQLYSILASHQSSLLESYNLSETEQTYWENQKSKLPLIYTYQYTTAYEYLVSMHGNYMICMLVTFFIAICLGNVFMEEHTRRTDQLILCARYGRGKLYCAKILAGSIISFGAAFIFETVTVLGNFFSYGTEGFNAMIQMIAPWYPYSITAGETFLIMVFLLLLSSVLTGIVTMVLAEIMKNSIGAMAIIAGGLFAARLVTLPPFLGLLARLWNTFIPINLLKLDYGFSDLKLVSFAGIQLTSWQFAPVLYILIGIFAVVVGKRAFCHTQISGR